MLKSLAAAMAAAVVKDLPFPRFDGAGRVKLGL